ncbi:MAG: hypothetical protein ACRC5G_03365 [Cetobacterium sp.]
MDLLKELNLLQYALIHCNYEPSNSDIELEFAKDKINNRFNVSNKPRLRSRLEIIIDLKKKYCKELLK